MLKSLKNEEKISKIIEKISEKPFNAKELKDLTAKLIQIISENNFIKKLELECPNLPLSIFPKELNETNYNELSCDMPLMNKLVMKVSQDKEFILQCLGEMANNDKFISKQLEIFTNDYESQKSFGFPTLAINRADYILDKNLKKFLQVEINTISCAYTTISEQAFLFHKNFLNKIGIKRELPDLETTNLITESIRHTVLKYESIYHTKTKPIIIIIISPLETNNEDHNNIITSLKTNFDLTSYKLTLNQAGEMLKLNETTYELEFKGSPVALVYYRAGYCPSHYPTSTEWMARQKLESARCFKCPSIGLQLAGSKKVQQKLSSVTQLEKYLDKNEVERVVKYFAEMKEFEKNGLTVRMALREEDKWVMKPNREGGGHLLSGEKMVNALKKNSNLGNYILMRKIEGEVTTSLFLRNNEIEIGNSISELGVFGTNLFYNGTHIINNTAGWLLRTKKEKSIEGGIHYGSGFIDSFYITKP